jgi:putative flippase GtrA
VLQGVFRHLTKYAIVGSAAALADFAVYALLAKGLHVHPPLANLASRPLGGVVGFTLNRIWTFRGQWQNGSIGVQIARFWTVWGVNFSISECLVWTLHDFIGLGPILTKICAEGVVTTFGYLAMRYWTFR